MLLGAVKIIISRKQICGQIVKTLDLKDSGQNLICLSHHVECSTIPTPSHPQLALYLTMLPGSLSDKTNNRFHVCGLCLLLIFFFFFFVFVFSFSFFFFFFSSSSSSSVSAFLYRLECIVHGPMCMKLCRILPTNSDF